MYLSGKILYHLIFTGKIKILKSIDKAQFWRISERKKKEMDITVRKIHFLQMMFLAINI